MKGEIEEGGRIAQRTLFANTDQIGIAELGGIEGSMRLVHFRPCRLPVHAKVGLTDLWLLALAVKHGRRFAAFDEYSDASQLPAGPAAYLILKWTHA